MIRASGLDELPQVLNIVRGEMSVVGPRPCIPYEYERYTDWQRSRFESTPGLTGLWQVLRHDELDYTRRISLDMHYIEHRSLRLDLEILLRTLPSVLARRGAY